MKNNDPMYMIWHDNKRAQFDEFEPLCQSFPFPSNNFACGVQLHLSVRHIPKQTFPSLCNDGDVIRTCLRIIVPWQTDRSAVMFGRVVFHRAFLFNASNRQMPASPFRPSFVPTLRLPVWPGHLCL